MAYTVPVALQVVDPTNLQLGDPVGLAQHPALCQNHNLMVYASGGPLIQGRYEGPVRVSVPAVPCLRAVLCYRHYGLTTQPPPGDLVLRVVSSLGGNVASSAVAATVPGTSSQYTWIQLDCSVQGVQAHASAIAYVEFTGSGVFDCHAWALHPFPCADASAGTNGDCLFISSEYWTTPARALDVEQYHHLVGDPFKVLQARPQTMLHLAPGPVAEQLLTTIFTGTFPFSGRDCRLWVRGWAENLSNSVLRLFVHSPQGGVAVSLVTSGTTVPASPIQGWGSATLTGIPAGVWDVELRLEASAFVSGGTAVTLTNISLIEV